MSDSPQRYKSSIAAVTITWIVIQTAPLMLCAMDVPLWARGTWPVQRFALQAMLVVQVGASALLFPWLLATRARSIVVIVLAEINICASGVIARTSIPNLVEAGAGLFLWLIALRVWAVQLFGRSQRLIAVLAATLVTVGGVISLYLWTEFAEQQTQNMRVLLWMVPSFALLAGLWTRHKSPEEHADRFSTN